MRSVVMARSGNDGNVIVKGLVSVKQSDGSFLKNIVGGLFGSKHLVLELVSAELDPSKFHFFASIYADNIYLVSNKRNDFCDDTKCRGKFKSLSLLMYFYKSQFYNVIFLPTSIALLIML